MLSITVPGFPKVLHVLRAVHQSGPLCHHVALFFYLFKVDSLEIPKTCQDCLLLFCYMFPVRHECWVA